MIHNDGRLRIRTVPLAVAAANYETVVAFAIMDVTAARLGNHP